MACPARFERATYKTDFVITPSQKPAIEAVIANEYPKLFSKLYKGNGIYLQGMEGDILMKAMLDLIGKDVPSLHIYDAIYVQKKYQLKAKKTLEKAWMAVLDVKFKPAIKIDEAD